MQRKYFQIFLHVLACIAFLAFAVLLAPGPGVSLESLSEAHTLRDIITYLLIFLFFYWNFYFLMPRYYFHKKHFRYIFCVVISFLAIIIIPRLIFFSERNTIEMHRRSPRHEREENERRENCKEDSLQLGNIDRTIGGKNNSDNDFEKGDGPGERMEHHEHHTKFLGFDLHHLAFEATQNLVLFIFVILFSLVIRTRSQLRAAEKEKLNAELSYLKAQINPHFLFNTLNSIYSLAIEKSDATPTAVVKLSGMMRYVLTESSAEFVSLEKEINYIRDFVDLQKIRLGDTAKVQFEVSGEFIGNRIAPLILIAFIENAFKHGVNPEEKSNISVHIRVSNKNLFLLVKNKKVNSISNSDLSNQVGLENTINRLDLIYNSKYKLKFNDLAEEYSVELTLELI